jgi:integron integrase
MLCIHTVLNGDEKPHPFASAIEIGSPAGSAARTDTLLHYTMSTEQTYVHWVKAFIRFHRLRHPAGMGRAEIEAFLSWLTNERRVAVSTHKQALSALLFLYGKVLGVDLPWMNDIGRPRTKRRLLVVLTPDEVAGLLCLIAGERRLLAQLLYGTGMRINEGLQLRAKDIDFERRTVIVREGKGGKDHAVMLPECLVRPLREQLARARVLWADDGRCGRAGWRQYPRAGTSWAWFRVFPQADVSVDPRSGVVRRHHRYGQTFQRAFKRAVTCTGLTKLATPHTLRHSFATALCSQAMTSGRRRTCPAMPTWRPRRSMPMC